jgi:O-antigen/teichoic acid export membrane protein
VSETQHDIGRFFRHSGVYALGNALNRLGAFLLLPLYTNYLSVAEYGELELFYVIGAVVSGLLSIGIAHATLRFYFEYTDQEERDAVVTTNLIASLVITGAGVLPLVFYAENIARYFFHDVGLALGIWLILATLVLELSSQVSLAYLRAREHSVFFITVSFSKLVVQIAVNAVLLMWFDTGLLGVLTGNLAAVALGWLVLTGFTVRHCGMRFAWGKLIPVLKYSYPFLLSTIVALVSTNVDRFLINSLLSLEALGLYALATKFSRLLTDLIGEPFSRAYGAFRFTIMGKENAAAIQARIVRYLFAAGCFAALGLAYFIEVVLRVMSAPAYWEAAALVPILALAGSLRLLIYPMETGILYGKDTRQIFYICSAMAVFNTAGGLALITWLGLAGACLTVLVAAVIEVALTNHISQRYFPVTYGYARLLRILGLTVGFYLASLPLGQYGLWPAFALKWVLLALYVFVLTKVGVFEADEIAQVRLFLGRGWRVLRGAT